MFICTSSHVYRIYTLLYMHAFISLHMHSYIWLHMHSYIWLHMHSYNCICFHMISYEFEWYLKLWHRLKSSTQAIIHTWTHVCTFESAHNCSISNSDYFWMHMQYTIVSRILIISELIISTQLYLKFWLFLNAYAVHQGICPWRL